MLWISHGPRGQGFKRWEGGGPVRGQHEARQGAGGQACPGVRAAGPAVGDRWAAQEGGSRNLKPQGCFLLDGEFFFASYSKSSNLSCETQGLKKVSLGELYVCSRLLTISWGVLDQFTHFLCAPRSSGVRQRYEHSFHRVTRV